MIFDSSLYCSLIRSHLQKRYC